MGGLQFLYNGVDVDAVEFPTLPTSTEAIEKAWSDFDDTKRTQYFAVLRQTGLSNHAAVAAGIHPKTVSHFKDSDPDFKEEWDAAMEFFRDRLRAESYRRAVIGWDEPVVGGKDRDEVVCQVRRYSDRLLEIELKRHDPSYSEARRVSAEIRAEVNVQANVTFQEKMGNALVGLAQNLMAIELQQTSIPHLDADADDAEFSDSDA